MNIQQISTSTRKEVNKYMTIRRLPEVKGYTVDLRLKQFRKIQRGKPMEFISFEDKKGRDLFWEWIIKNKDLFIAEVQYYNSINQPLDHDICFVAALVAGAERKAKCGDLLLEDE